MHEGGWGTRTRHVLYLGQQGPERARKNPKSGPNSKRNPFLVKILYQELCPCTHPARAALGCMGLPCPGRSHLQTVCACVVLGSMGLGSTAGSPVRPEAVVLLQCTRISTAALHPQVVLPNPGTTSETWPGGGKGMPCLWGLPSLQPPASGTHSCCTHI